MNPAYGIILWIVIGGLAGLVGGKIMGTSARQNVLTDIVLGVVGAVVGGFVARAFFNDDVGNNGITASFLVALLGACIVIFAWKKLSGNRRLA